LKPPSNGIMSKANNPSLSANKLTPRPHPG